MNKDGHEEPVPMVPQEARRSVGHFSRFTNAMRTESYRAWLRGCERPLRCSYCKCKLTVDDATVDHAMPTSMGGLDHPDNWRACCRRCNNAKHDLTEVQYRKIIESHG